MNEGATSARAIGPGCSADDTIVSSRPSISFADDKTIAIQKVDKNNNKLKFINYVNKVEKVQCNLHTVFAVDQNTSNDDKKLHNKKQLQQQQQQCKEKKLNYVGSLVKCRFE